MIEPVTMFLQRKLGMIKVKSCQYVKRAFEENHTIGSRIDD